MNVRQNRLPALAAVVLAGGLALSACGGSGGTAVGTASSGSDGGGAAAGGSQASGTITGAGATSMGDAQTAWSQNFGAMSAGATVTYTGGGSGKGREQFLNGAVQFAGSDDAMKPEEIEKSKTTCQGGTAFDVPVYISPIAIVYKLDGVEDLQLSPKTLAGIFAGTITSWDAPEIAADNPGVTLPAKPVVPVHRYDKSGTTGNFTDFLSANAADVWTFGKVEEWPIEGGQNGDGTGGLVSTVNAGDGTIGYADLSKAGDLGVAKIKIGDEYRAPSADGAAAAVSASPREEGRGDKDIVVKVDRTVTENGSYPLLLVSYMVMCDTYKDEATATTVKDYATYVVSEQGQQAGSEASGSGKLTDDLRTDAMKGIDSIKAGS